MKAMMTLAARKTTKPATMAAMMPARIAAVKAANLATWVMARTAARLPTRLPAVMAARMMTESVKRATLRRVCSQKALLANWLCQGCAPTSSRSLKAAMPPRNGGRYFPLSLPRIRLVLTYYRTATSASGFFATSTKLLATFSASA